MKFFRRLVNGCAIALMLFMKEARNVLVGVGLFVLTIAIVKWIGA